MQIAPATLQLVAKTIALHTQGAGNVNGFCIALAAGKGQ